MSFPAADQARPPPIPTSLVHQTHQAYAIMPKYGTSPDPQYWITIPRSTPSHPHYIWPRLMSVSWVQVEWRKMQSPSLSKPWALVWFSGNQTQKQIKRTGSPFPGSLLIHMHMGQFLQDGIFCRFVLYFFLYFLYFVVLQIFYWPSELYFKLFIDGYTWSH